jgi:hypothetical protein
VTGDTAYYSKSGRIQRSIARSTDQILAALILEGTIIQPRWWLSQRGRLATFIVLIVLSLLASFAYQIWVIRHRQNAIMPSSATVATGLIAIIASVFAYFQWNDTRRELSIDRFYDRLALINSRYCEWDTARQLVSHFWPTPPDEATFQKAMYVYLELDNLEYIVMRYQLGFVTRGLLQRAVRTFSSRCQSREFSEIACELVKGAGYMSRMGPLVESLSDLAREASIPSEVPAGRLEANP